MEQFKKYLYGAYAAVVAILAAALYYFVNKSRGLTSKNAQLESENSVRDQIVRLNESKKEDDNAEDEYRMARDAFIRQSLGNGDRKG